MESGDWDSRAGSEPDESAENEELPGFEELAASAMPPLAPPPRAVPWRVRCHLLAGPKSLAGSVLWMLGCVVLAPFVMDWGWLGDWQLSGGCREAPAELHAVQTAFLTRRWQVVRYQYSFRLPDGTEVRGRSYTNGSAPILYPGDEVIVQYAPGRPGLSRLRDTHAGLHEPSFWLLVPVLLLLGALFLIVVSWKRGRRVIGVLRSGLVIPHEEVSLLRDLDGGFIHHREVSGSQPMLCDPEQPALAVAVSRLGDIWVGGAGEWRESLGPGPILRLLLSVAAVLGGPVLAWMWMIHLFP